MARVTVEDCLEVVDNQYDLVILAKERTLQIGAGDKPMVSENNDKKTVLSLKKFIKEKFQSLDRQFYLQKDPERFQLQMLRLMIMQL